MIPQRGDRYSVAEMTRRHAALLIALAAALVAVAWKLSPAASPPLYDGLCTADPYRLVGGNPPPLSASKMYPAGNSPSTVLTTDEQLGPAQAEMLMTDGTLVSPHSPYTVTITPMVPPGPAPAGMRIDGNAYRLTAVTDSGMTLQPQPQHPVTILLRGTADAPPRTLGRFEGNTWTLVQTLNPGCGSTFEAASNTLGAFALLYSPSSPAGGGGVVAAVIAASLLVVILATVIGLRRLDVSRRSPRR